MIPANPLSSPAVKTSREATWSGKDHAETQSFTAAEQPGLGNQTLGYLNADRYWKSVPRPPSLGSSHSRSRNPDERRNRRSTAAANTARTP